MLSWLPYIVCKVLHLSRWFICFTQNKNKYLLNNNKYFYSFLYYPCKITGKNVIDRPKPTRRVQFLQTYSAIYLYGRVLTALVIIKPQPLALDKMLHLYRRQPTHTHRIISWIKPVAPSSDVIFWSKCGFISLGHPVRYLRIV